jgi:hypothetical protein
MNSSINWSRVGEFVIKRIILWGAIGLLLWLLALPFRIVGEAISGFGQALGAGCAVEVAAVPFKGITWLLDAIRTFVNELAEFTA